MDGRFQTEEEGMTCFMCKGTVKDGLSTFTADMGGCVVVIKNVPSSICDQCGETSYNDKVARQLEQIVQNITMSVSAEIAVVSYSEKAA
jgi:YgiT-type zinc finger domain-containing protein